MKRTTIFTSVEFEVISYGNGTAYSINAFKRNTALHYGGDDAIEFRDKLDNFEEYFPDKPIDEFLNAIVDEYGI